jgi:DNA-binding CsgD family transcriptional regulator
MSQLLCPVLVGRSVEVRALESALEEALGGRGSCVVLTGEAGLGKSRLIRELVQMAGNRGARVVTGRAVPTSTAAAYRPWTEALLQLLRSETLPKDPTLVPWLSHLAALLPGIVGDEGPAESAGADAIRGEAVLRLLCRLCPEGLVVALEDMHWADPDSVALLEYLADNAASQRLLLVVSLRTESPSPATELVRRQRGRPGVVRVGLSPLSEREVAEMIVACRPEADASVCSRIVRASDGVPLLVEELLASPGVPESIIETVRSRLAEFPSDERVVVEAAAVTGHHFDWQILPAASGQSRKVVARALDRAVDALLVSTDSDGFRFRHALTREAVVETMLPSRMHAAASDALAAIDAAHPYLEGAWREVAAELAARMGDRSRAGRLLTDAGRYSVQVGALGTAVDTLRRAVALQEGTAEGTGAELALVEALALAGRVDEAAAEAMRLLGRVGDDPATTDIRIEAHLRVAHAAVAASRWPLAHRHIAAAAGLADDGTNPRLSARAAVLSAEVVLADGDLDGARAAAEEVLAMHGAGPDSRCHAYEIVGRTRRLHDLPAAQAAFEAALATAERDDLPVWRLRALHELGTVDMFARVDVDRLLEARQLGEQMGALSTVAVLDLQLAASFTARWDLERCDVHAASALDVARRLGLGQVAAKALALMAGSASMRADPEATERLGSQATATDPSEPMLGAFCRASAGMALFMAGDADACIGPFAEGTAALSRLPNAEPISIRALWPLIQAARGDRRAPESIEQLRRLGVDAFHLNHGMIALAEAVLEGRAGRPGRADVIVAGLATSFVNCEAWADLARFIAAPRALADGWGEPLRWLAAARDRFAALGLHRLGGRCAELLRDTPPNPWAGAGVTDREADVLRLVIDGLANKEIASALGLSPRTVEKHVESLLRKAGARSRTELAVNAGRATT